MKNRHSLRYIMQFIAGVLLVVFGYAGSSTCTGNMDNIYLNNIEWALPNTPRQRALIQVNKDAVNSEKFEKYRQNIFKSNDMYSNAYRLSNSTYTLSINGFTFTPQAKLADFSFNSLTKKNDNMLSPSFGATPATEAECQNSIILDSETAKTIVSNVSAFNSLSDLVGAEIEISNPQSPNFDANSTKLKVSSIIYLVNDKPYLEYLNMFVYLSHSSVVYIPNGVFDSLTFNSDCEYYSNIVYAGAKEYPFRTFYYLKEMLGNTSSFSFPSSKSNVVEKSIYSQMSDVTLLVDNFRASSPRVILNVLFAAMMLYGFYFFSKVYSEMDPGAKNQDWTFASYMALSVCVPILMLYLITLRLHYLYINSVHVPIFGTTNTLIFVIFASLFIFVNFLKYKNALNSDRAISHRSSTN
jgi:hypothetical protein